MLQSLKTKIKRIKFGKSINTFGIMKIPILWAAKSGEA